MATQVAYCLRSELSIWGAPGNAFEDVDPDVQDKCISGASAIIDSYLKESVVLPLVSWGVDVRRAAAIIAAYDLIMASRGSNPTGDGQPDPLEVRYKDTIRWLENIAKGIVVSSAVGSPASSGGTASTPGRAVILSNTQRGWQNNDGTGGAFSGGR